MIIAITTTTRLNARYCLPLSITKISTLFTLCSEFSHYSENPLAYYMYYYGRLVISCPIKVCLFSLYWLQETRVNKESMFQVVPDFHSLPLHENRFLKEFYSLKCHTWHKMGIIFFAFALVRLNSVLSIILFSSCVQLIVQNVHSFTVQENC